MCKKSNAARLLLVLGVCAASGSAAEPLHLADLTREALSNNREVLAAERRYEAARQRQAPARSLPDPTLSVGYTSNGGPLPGQGLGSNPTSNIGFTITQELPSATKRRLRGEIAAKEADAEFQEWQAVELSVRSRLAQAYHRLHHAWAVLDLLARGKDNVSSLLRVSEARYTAGKVAQQDIFRAQAQLSALETRVIRAQQDRQSAEAEINSLLNRQPGTPLEQPAEEESTSLPVAVDQLLAKAAELSPELRRATAMIERSELGVNLARKELHPDYTIAAGYFTQGSMPPMYQVRVDIPLRLHTASRQRPAINEQVDLLAEARHNFEAAEQSLEFRVRDAYLAAETAWRLRNLYADTVLPQSQLAIESGLAAYESGASDLIAVLNSIAAKIDVEDQMHEQEMNFLVAEARLEELTAVDLTKERQGKDLK